MISLKDRYYSSKNVGNDGLIKKLVKSKNFKYLKSKTY